MTDGNQNAYAIGTNYPGLTKRELFAAMAMQGLLAADPGYSLTSLNVATYALEQADDLILALNYKVVE